MKVILISYANKPFIKSQKLLKKSALKYGVDEVVNYNDKWLREKKDFYSSNRAILEKQKGAGYWLWKPYIILDALNNMDDDDVLIHLDAGTLIIDNVKPLVDIAQKNEIILFYNNGHKNSEWTKRDCFVLMDCDEQKYYDAVQVLGGYLVCRKTSFVIELMKEWLYFGQDERVIGDGANLCGLDNLEGFKEHRHDQSILTNLAVKYQIEIFREPSQWGNHYKLPKYRKKGEFLYKQYDDKVFTNSPYPTILNAHRTKSSLNFLEELQYFLLNFKTIKTT